MTTTPIVTLTKKFESSEAMQEWLKAPLSRQLYNIKFIDHVTNSVKVTGRKL